MPINFILALIMIGQISIDPDFEKKVLDCRKYVDEYRLAHNATKDKYLASDLLVELYDSMNKEEITLDEFFKDSEDYNAQTLGYENVKELLDKGSLNDKSAYELLWK